MTYCFSTDMIDLHYQAPDRNQRESRYYWDELWALISAAGFHRIEIPYEPKWDFGGRSGIPRTKRSIATKFGTTAAFLDFLRERGIDGIDSICFDPTMFCQGDADTYLHVLHHFTSEAISFAAESGARVFSVSATPTCAAVHSLCPGAVDPEAFRQEFLAKNAGVLTQLAAAAASAGISFCLKNEYWGLLPGEAIYDYVCKLPDTVLLDADTAHLTASGADPAAFIRRYADRIGVIHFTDTCFTADQDCALQPLPAFPAKRATQVFRDPGQGTVDFPAIKSLLDTTGYPGPVIISCRQTRDPYRALLRSRYYIDHVLNDQRKGGN